MTENEELIAAQQAAEEANTRAIEAERVAAETEKKAVDAEKRATEAEAKAEAAGQELAEARERLKATEELTPEEKEEKARRDTRRSSVRIRVTYIAASFLFVAGAGVVGYLLAVGNIPDAKDLFLAILPVSAAIVTYWFATRQGEPMNVGDIVKVIEASRKQT